MGVPDSSATEVPRQCECGDIPGLGDLYCVINGT